MNVTVEEITDKIVGIITDFSKNNNESVISDSDAISW